MEETGKWTSFMAQDGNTSPSPAHSLYTCQHLIAVSTEGVALACARLTSESSSLGKLKARS